MMVTTGGGSKTHVYSYDATYQLTHADYPPELSYLATDTTFDYDAAGNRTSVIDGSGTTPYSTNSLNQYTSADGTSFQYDASGNMTHDATYAYGYDPENRLVKVHKSGSLPPPTLGQALDSGLTYTTGGADEWTVAYGESKQGQYSAQSGNIDDEQESYLQTQVTGSGTVTFWWKVSSEQGCDYLEFWLDGVRQSGPISGNVDWTEVSYPVSGAGPHTLRWRYVKDGSVSTDNDCGWVDWVQWSGSSPPAPEPDPAAWLTLLYHYDATGRRVEKKYDSSVVTKYVYDGDSCIAEYDVSGNLRRKYIYGPGIDQPVCMIEAAGSYAGTYYYHFDALGSVVGLTNASGNTVEVYDYDVYGRVGATDASHPNRFMFTGREFDKETGLYYYRARYYKPEIGRFLQTDPVGYEAGMNLYCYCNNNPWNLADPYGMDPTDGNDSISVSSIIPSPPSPDPKPPDCTAELIAYVSASEEYVEKIILEGRAKDMMDDAWASVTRRIEALTVATAGVAVAQWNVTVRCGKWYSWRRASPACRVAVAGLAVAIGVEAAAVFFLGQAVAKHQMAVTAYVEAREAAREAETKKDEAKAALERCLGHSLEE